MKMEKFKYVVNRPEPPKLCFGTMSERKIVTFHNPKHYSKSLGSVNFKKIFKGSFSRTPRFVKCKEKYNSIFYDLPKEEIKPTINLFKRVGRDIDFNKNVVPGVGRYKIIFARKTNSIHSFGGVTKKVSAIHTICKYMDQSCCQRCKLKPIPAEYFRNFVNGKDFCKNCMNEEILIAKKRKEKVRLLMELEKYHRVRYCGFYHHHQNTSAKIKLLPRMEVVNKIRRENYLSTFHY